MSSYRTPFTLPVRYKQESGHHIENEFLFGLYENLFNPTPSTTEALNRYYSSAKLRGFPNHIVNSVPEKQLSHDQLTAYHCYAKMTGKLDDVELFNSFIHNFKFKNDTLHPRDYFYYRLLGKKWQGFLGLPVIYLLKLISAFVPWRITLDSVDRPDQVFRLGKILVRQKLSGELLYWLKIRSVDDDKLLRACMRPVELIIKTAAKLRFGDIKEMFITYFQNDSNHPVVKKLQE